jgi:hypothetical protein
MRFVPLLLAATLVASPLKAQTAPAAADANAIMRVVLAFETRVHRDAEVGPPPCVRLRVGSASLGDARRSVEETEAFENRPALPPARPEARAQSGPVTVVNSRVIPLSPFHIWRRVPERNRGYVESDGPLSADLEAAVRAAERAALVAPLQPQRVPLIRTEWFDQPLIRCRNMRIWPALEFGAPVIVGEFAFVRVDFDCVLCGQGTMLALRRVGAAWDIIAAAEKCVS